MPATGRWMFRIRRWYSRVQGTWDCSEGVSWLRERYLEPRLHSLRATFRPDAFPRYNDRGSWGKHFAQRIDLWRTNLVDCELREHKPHIKHALQRLRGPIWHRWCPSPPMGFKTPSGIMKKNKLPERLLNRNWDLKKLFYLVFDELSQFKP